MALIFFSALWVVPPVHAQDELPATLNPDAQTSYTFGQRMSFSLQVTNAPQLVAGTLFVSTPQFQNTYSASFEIQAAEGDRVLLNHDIDLTTVRFQPFTEVTYWWTLKTADDNLIQLPEQLFEYQDDRFNWKTTEKAGVEVYWIADGLDLGQVALDIVLESLPRIQSVIQADLPDPLRIYLYPSANDMRAALLLSGQDWVGGHASPELGVILLPAENPRTAVVDLRRRLPHEMSHLLLYEATGASYGNVPRWFDEGLATLFESVPNPNYEPALQHALDQGEVLTFEEMCVRFPDTSTNQIYLAYAQSGSLIKFIQAKYGNEALRQMILAYADGATCESAVSRSLSISLQELSDDWLGDLQPSSSSRIFNQNLIWIIILFGGFGITLLLALIPSQR